MEEHLENINSYLSFKLGNEFFAANIRSIINILEIPKITTVPKSPAFMKGVINLRGMVLPIIDTRLKFGMEEIAYTKNTCILVLELMVDNEQINVGAIVDSAEEVFEIDTDEIKLPPSIGNKIKEGFIKGIVNFKKEFVMVLDMDRVFSTEDTIEMITAAEIQELSK